MCWNHNIILFLAYVDLATTAFAANTMELLSVEIARKLSNKIKLSNKRFLLNHIFYMTSVEGILNKSKMHFGYFKFHQHTTHFLKFQKTKLF